MAGDFFVFKCAGAAADLGDSLERVEALARHANESCRSMGVALGACSLPQTGMPNFEIGPDDMEIGMGIHGEPGIRRGPLASADTVTDLLLDPVVADLGLAAGDRVAVLVNGLGATTQLELFVICSAACAGRSTPSASRSMPVGSGNTPPRWRWHGASVTLLRVDDDLTRLLDHPCYTPALRVGSALEPRSNARRTPRQARAVVQAAAINRAGLKAGGAVTPAVFLAMMRAVAAAIRADKD